MQQPHGLSPAPQAPAPDTAARPAMAPQVRLQFEPACSGWVLLHPQGEARLNLPAAEILMRCDGRRSIDEIVRELEEAFFSPALRQDVQAFLAEARGHGWVALEMS